MTIAAATVVGGIEAENSGSGVLSITTTGSVGGGEVGIRATSTGAATVDIAGNVTGTQNAIDMRDAAAPGRWRCAAAGV